MQNNTWFELVVRWFLGTIFLYASIHKIASPEQFAKIIYGYYLFPQPLCTAQAYYRRSHCGKDETY